MLKVLEYDKANLTDTEISIIEKIIEDPKFFTNKTITELAKNYYVSESTITRMAKHLGYKNIKRLQMHVYERLNFLSKNYYINDTLALENIVNNIRVYYSYSIHETIDNLDLPVLDGLINNLVIKKRIFTFGIGTSFLPCRVLSNNLNMIGHNCFATEDVHSLIVMMQNMEPEDLLIIFSKSGVTKEIVSIINLANKFNIEVALITNNKELNKLYQIKHLLLFELHSQENEGFPSLSLSAKVVQILIADIIFCALIKIKQPDLEDKIIRANNLTKNWNDENF
ncbi:hypothetical protein P344_05795 [Spiroplasma mirum ATCC 29335]|uniref:RpiR family transcriptional regulator n=1 Tax=Spiroplasma mirum ATCC 29335 TaxID=838561 RepID=W0GM56_9MOLU|nr:MULTISPECIES: MurR/RpiR family transcriptional regulator [Spiroplasma]AHF61345.1 putative transcriptional regulator [Spiroplasma mirum ATCC 29335]AHI58466.1 hypothetical protein P344_05795 [Spiroplasma mirum ATCC 29335]AKM53399.1 RpiR family transcriptional regulator [Spiroplasma atrichopogonis]